MLSSVMPVSTCVTFRFLNTVYYRILLAFSLNRNVHVYIDITFRILSTVDPMDKHKL